MTSPMQVLIAGGGIAAVEAALALDTLAGDRVEVRLLTPRAELVDRPRAVLTPFAGALPPRVPLERLAERGIAVEPGAVASVDAAGRSVRTRAGQDLPYDRLVVAVGARASVAIHGAITFHGPRSGGSVEAALRRLAVTGEGRLLVVLPPAVHWALPAYELALMSVNELARLGAPDVEVGVVTPEARPLDVFGAPASDAAALLLERAGIGVRTGAHAEAVLDGTLVIAGGALLPAREVIALPRLEGPRIPGLPADEDGFLPADPYGRVLDSPGVYAAGDVTARAVKQGGLAAQQADAVAEAIAAEAGADVTPQPYRPVLRAVLLTGDEPLYLHADDSGRGTASRAPLWQPPDKVVARHVAAFLDGRDDPEHAEPESLER